MNTLFQLPALKFAFDALEPAIDAKTMEIHHDKHHAAYVNNLNKALEAAPELYGRSIEDICAKSTKCPNPFALQYATMAEDMPTIPSFGKCSTQAAPNRLPRR